MTNMNTSNKNKMEEEEDMKIKEASEMIDWLQHLIHKFSDTNNLNNDDDGTTTTTAKLFWTSNSPQLKDIIHRYSPIGLESQFEQLYGLLHPCLVQRDQENNAAAFCLGQRGMGKGLLLERCLQAMTDEIRYYGYNNRNHVDVDNNVDASSSSWRRMFRVVRVHGVLIPGNDVGLVVKDMLQQLSKRAYEESAHITTATTTTTSNNTTHSRPSSSSSSTDMNDKSNDNNSNSNSNKRAKLLVEEEQQQQAPATKAAGGQQQQQETTPQQQQQHQNVVEENLTRLRMGSSFESNLQLLGETLKLARLDRIPILIILDEVDAFLGGSGNSAGSNNNNNNASNNVMVEATRDRQLLLYHLLDRVATQGSNLCLVGLTQQFALKKQLEKRIKSRMEGTSKEIFVGTCPSMTSLVRIILSNFESLSSSSHDDDDDDDTTRRTTTTATTATPQQQLHQQLSQILTPPPSSSNNAGSSFQKRVYETLVRECHTQGNNIRWFQRIFSFSFSVLRGEWIRYRSQIRQRRRQRQKQQQHSTTQVVVVSSPSPLPRVPHFEASHIMDALVAQGARISVEPPVIMGNSGSSGSSSQQQQQQHVQRKRTRNLVIMGQHGQPVTAVDPRIQALLDMSAPQVALMLSARRILARDSQWNGETASPPPLTLGRILQEYNKPGTGRFGNHLLLVAFQELMEQGLVRPAIDHIGGGPFQYEFNKTITISEDIPLHLLVDTNRELMEALQCDLLECSTALKEWGRKTNSY